MSSRRNHEDRSRTRFLPRLAGLLVWLTAGGVIAHILGRAIGDAMIGAIVTLLLFIVLAPFLLPRGGSSAGGRRRSEQ